jgi:hypothetical protein
VTDHQQITQDAIGAPVTFAFDGQTRIDPNNPNSVPYSFSPAAMNEIVLQNNNMDAESKTRYDAADHFDSEDFSGARGAIQKIANNRAMLNSILNKATMAPGDQKQAWDILGAMLHAIQDFYAHSTWVELGNTSIVGFGALTENTASPSMGALATAPAPGAANPVICDASGYPAFPGATLKLTTGYYDDPSHGATRIAPSGKCEHGSLRQAIGTCAFGILSLSGSTIPVFGISKDSPCADYSPFAIDAHGIAMLLAGKETLSFVQSIITDLNTASNSQGFCVLLGLDPKVVPNCAPGFSGTIQGTVTLFNQGGMILLCNFPDTSSGNCPPQITFSATLSGNQVVNSPASQISVTPAFWWGGADGASWSSCVGTGNNVCFGSKTVPTGTVVLLSRIVTSGYLDAGYCDLVITLTNAGGPTVATVVGLDDPLEIDPTEGGNPDPGATQGLTNYGTQCLLSPGIYFSSVLNSDTSAVWTPSE